MSGASVFRRTSPDGRPRNESCLPGALRRPGPPRGRSSASMDCDKERRGGRWGLARHIRCRGCLGGGRHNASSRQVKRPGEGCPARRTGGLLPSPRVKDVHVGAIRRARCFLPQDMPSSSSAGLDHGVVGGQGDGFLDEDVFCPLSGRPGSWGACRWVGPCKCPRGRWAGSAREAGSNSSIALHVAEVPGCAPGWAEVAADAGPGRRRACLLGSRLQMAVTAAPAAERRAGEDSGSCP